jgi:hypothetical protein
MRRNHAHVGAGITAHNHRNTQLYVWSELNGPNPTIDVFNLERLLPQDPETNLPKFANLQTCSKKHLPEQFPEGRNKPTDMSIVLAIDGGGNDTDDIAMILALWAKESSLELRPTGDHGPMQLTSWWRNYSDRNRLGLIVAGAYDSFGRPANHANRNKSFTGSISANVMTAGNIIRYSQSIGQTYRQIAYHYGPGSDKSEQDNANTRKTYADEAMRLKDRHALSIA